MKKIFIYNLVFFIVFFLTLEIGLGFFFNLNKQGIAAKIINESNLQPLFNYPYVNKKKIFGENVYTDKNGFRVSKNKFLSEDKQSDNKEKIYFIGGSVTFGAGLKQEDTFSGIIDNEKKFNVYNASVMGSNLKNNYFILKNKINRENLKLVIINFSLDDINDNTVPIIRNNLNANENKINTNKTLIENLKKNKIINNINNFIRANSKLYVFLKNYIFKAEDNYFYLAKEKYKIKENLNYMKAYLDKISYINEELNNKIIFISIPYSKEVDINNCLTNSDERNIIEKEFIIRKIKYYDLKSLFCDSKKRNLYLKFDPAHLSKNGHLEVYKFISKKIL